MSSASIAASPGPSESPPKKYRVPLSKIQTLTAQGKTKLSPDEIHLFQERGYLEQETASKALATICETTPPPSSSSSFSAAPAATSTDTTSSASPSHNVLPPSQRSPATPQGPFRTIGSSSPKAVPKGVATSIDHHSTRSDSPTNTTTKQPLPPFHSHTFHDTCSHLHPSQADLALRKPGLSSMDNSTSFRRHSETSAVVAVRPSVRSASISAITSYSLSRPRSSLSSAILRTPSSSSTQRRPSTLSSPSVVASPNGFRTVLYAASPGLTLYSLPTTSSIDEIASNTTPSMASFKFPATTTTPPPPTSLNTQQPSSSSSPLLNASSPILAPASSPLLSPRSKRKQSIPMRSPSLTDSHELSPGVIFQFPFGHSYARSARSPSSPLAGSDDGHGPTSAGQRTPPSHYPSPASSIRQLEHFQHGSGDLFAGQATPASPLTRSGLGIRVHEEGDYLEPGAVPHPLALALDHPTTSTTTTTTTTTASSSAGTKATADLDSMEIDPPAAVVAAAVAAAAATTPLAAQLERADIPTPPSTVTVPSTRRMEDSVPVKREPKVSPSLLSLPPATPSANLLDTPKSEKALADVEASTGEKDDHQDEQDEQDEEDASLLPLWAQRQLTIRRQSLIPRNELDFVKGSGIIPPPNTNLVLPGGARIKAYPTLLSDIVKVQREELLQEASRLAEEEAEMAAAAHHASKRRKASSASQGKGGRNSFSGQGTHHHDDDPDYTHDHQHDPDMNGVRTRRFSHAAQGLAAAAASDDMQTDRRRRRGGYGADDNDAYYPAGSSPTLGHGGEYHSGRPGKLGSPVELPNGTFDETVTPGRRGSKGKINRHGGKISKPSTGANPYSRERSWEDSRDADHHHHQGQFHHQQYSDEDGHHYSMQQRKTSIHGAKDKKPPKALTKSMDDMDQDGGDYTRRRSLSHIKEHPHQARYAMMPGSSPDSDMARQQQQQQHPGFGSSLRTLQPLLNATQYDHHHPPRYGDHLVEQQQQQQHGRPLLPPMAAAGRGGYNSSNSSQVPGMGDKKIKYNAAGPTKSSPKGNFGHAGHVKRGGGAPPHGKPRSSHLYGSTDESLAMAEALMEMHHVGAMDEHEDDDDDATEDEYVPHKRSNSGADYHYSDHSQDDGHHHSHPIKPSPVKKTTVGQKRKLSGQGKAAPTSGFGAMSPPQAKKKKAAHGDSSKGKTKDHKSTSSAGRHHGGGMSFDPTGAGSGSGAGAGTTPRSSSGSGGSSSSKHCEACGAKETPCWRPGYIPNTVLCNSCGLRYKKSNVFCTKIQCKYIPLKTEYASMEAERQEHGRDHLICIQCKGRVALPIPKEEA